MKLDRATQSALRVTGCALCVAAATAAAMPQTQAAPSTDSSEVAAGRIELRARLRGSGTIMAGQARYREEDKNGQVRREFKVQIEKATAGQSYDVVLDGASIGTITANALGRGEITFRNNSDNPGVNPNVPSVTSGSVVTVGPISGTLR